MLIEMLLAVAPLDFVEMPSEEPMAGASSAPISATDRAEDAFSECMKYWARRFVNGREGAETIANSAARLCTQQGALLYSAAIETGRSPTQARSWQADRLRFYRNAVIDVVMVLRAGGR